MSDKVIIITGANSGLGLETAKHFVDSGNIVVMAVRNKNKGEEAKAALLKSFPEAKIDALHLDLASLTSVHQFVETFSKNYTRLDLLINNAGVMTPPYSKTEEGYELQFGSNHLGHFALTGLLLPFLEKGEQPRVVTLSSIAHRNGVIDFDNLDGTKGYKAMKFYSQSKLANLMFAKELDERLKRNGYKTISLAAHPGISATNLFRIGKESTPWYIKPLIKLIAQPAEKGVLPTIMAATDKTLVGGEYIGPDGAGNRKGNPTIETPRKNVYNKETMKKLWDLSEELTSVRYNLL
ncbi:oxidoreductase [Litchfieldia salsa]|uniref:NAD(P)-dependent dehydrogenase, short-chain alcohol dehydrogenase family n=1 Tax=Litchfieldia salsa TaxID=930152 RepID=A0A1H0PG02_9BACI|nr:oxidoreductase [Litchfieldia salsa]SDP03588.1 NAD(P)-dependent dehydrogenase, short-chain alcohol dehydrogenase family [Litchfieldia salsa]